MTPIARSIYDAVRHFENVDRVSAGVIKNAGSGVLGVKVGQEIGCVFLKVRGSTTVQEVRIYTKHVQDVKLAVCRLVRDQGWRLSFKEE